MENTLRKYRAPLFGNRGSDVSAALDYVAEMSAASSDAIAISTAAYVLLNTVINAVDKMLASPSPEKLAIIELINNQIDTWAKDKLLDSLGQTMDSMLDDKIDSWMDDNLGDKVNDMIGDSVGDWADDNLGDRIESWMDDNLGNKINDIDLIVRVA